MSQGLTADGQLRTLDLLQALRAECGELWGTSSTLYHRIDALLRELANPNLHHIPMRLPFRVEMWDRSNRHIRCVISVGHAALDAAVWQLRTDSSPVFWRRVGRIAEQLGYPEKLRVCSE
jgi:hypothetical protein